MTNKLINWWKKFDDFSLFIVLIQVITYLLTIVSILSVCFVIYFKVPDYLPKIWHSGFNGFVSLFHDFKSLYYVTFSLIVAYLAIKRFIITKKKERELETFKLIDMFNADIVKNVFQIYTYWDSKDIPSTAISRKLKKDVFLKKEINDSQLIILERFFKKNQWEKSQIVLTIGQLNTLAFKIQKSEFLNKKLIKEEIGKPYCSIIESLYSIISYFRDNEDGINHYEPLVNLFNEWND